MSPKIEMFEVFRVHAQFDDEPRRLVEPDEVWYDTLDEALPAVKRVVQLGALVTVDRLVVDHFDNEDDADLDDWPQPRHVVEQEHTPQGWQPKQEKVQP